MPAIRTMTCHALAICAGISLAIFSGLLFDRREPITILPGKIEPYYVRNGTPVVVTWPLIENRACAGELRRVVRDSGRKIHEFSVEPTIYHQVLSHDARTFSKNMTMPYGMAPGLGFYYGIGTRWCNELQHFIWPIPFVSPEIPICVLAEKGEPDAPCAHGDP